MNYKKQMMFFTLLLSVLTNSSSAEIVIKNPYFNNNNQSGAFFESPIVMNDANDFHQLHKKTWDFPTKLKHKKWGNKEITNCFELNSHLDKGFTVANLYEFSFVNAQRVICSMWQLIGKFKSYNKSYMNNVKLNKDFASIAPASFSLQISNEQVEKVKSSANWNVASKIQKVDVKNDNNATFYDNSGSIQRLTLMAKGDYNADGIEDQMYFVENSVEGGSYSSSKVFIITRITADAPLDLLEEI